MNQEEIQVRELEDIAEKLEELVKDYIETEFYEIRAKAYMYKSGYYYNYSVEIWIYRKYYEISEVCMDVESEEEFNECYEEHIKEINEEATIELELKYISQHVKIETHPLRCDGDYCKAGLYIEIGLESVVELNAEEIFEIVKPVLDIAFSETTLNLIETARIFESKYLSE